MSEDVSNAMQMLALTSLQSADSISKMGGEFNALQTSLAHMVGSIATISEQLSSSFFAVTETLWEFASNMQSMAGSSLDAVGDFSTNVVKAGGLAYGVFMDLEDQINNLGGKQKGGGGGVMEVFKSTFGSMNLQEMFTRPGLPATPGLNVAGAHFPAQAATRKFAPIKGMAGMAGTAGKAMMGGLAAMGPQMLALSLIMKPIGALLEGLLEPLEPLIDLFGMVGEIIGLLLVPIVQVLMEILMPFMPLLLEIIMGMMPLIKFMLIPLKILGVVLQAVIPVLTAVFGAFAQLGRVLDVVTAIIMGVVVSVMSIINVALRAISGFFDSIRNWIRNVIDGIISWFRNIVDTITDLFDDMKFWKRD